MSRFIEGADRNQATLLPERLDDYIGEDNPVRAVDAFVDELDLKQLGFAGANPATTGRPAYHPALREQMRRMDAIREELKQQPDEQLSLTDPDARSMISQAKGTAWSVTTCRRWSMPSIT